VLYHWFELGRAALRPARAAADSCRLFFNPFNPLSHTPLGRSAVAACEVFERATRHYQKPAFGIARTKVGATWVEVAEEVVWQSPFCRLLHFKRDIPRERAAHDPRLLLVAPMSGHFATLLRGTVETFLPDHEVFITDWQDARSVPLAAGHFDLDDYIDTMIALFRFMGGDLHVFAVCQPSVPVLAATALMEADGDPSVPLTITMAGGPIDTRINPTTVNALAEQRGTEWFRRNVITTLPWSCPGSGREVYPGFLQLSGFMTMNLDRHMQAHKAMFLHLVRGDGDSAAKHREFYDEYLAVMDLAAEFYLQTVETVFVKHALPRGIMQHRGRPVDLSAIRHPALMTVEGEKDDITGTGQCRAALDLCSGVPQANKVHFDCPKVGHYGIFNGARFRAEIAPRMAKFMRAHDPCAAGMLSIAQLEHMARMPKRARRTQEMDALAFSFGAS
jgi:poly(3-hydroxybutyrate) depolymerase